MPQISKKKLRKEVLEKIYSRLAKAVSSVGNKHRAESFMGDFFTHTERIMFAKRLTIIFLLSENTPAYAIGKLLGVSSSTINYYKIRYQRGDFASIVARYRKKSEKRDFWEDVGALITFGMPPYVGKGRWRWLNDLEDQYKQRTLR